MIAGWWWGGEGRGVEGRYVRSFHFHRLPARGKCFVFFLCEIWKSTMSEFVPASPAMAARFPRRTTGLALGQRGRAAKQNIFLFCFIFWGGTLLTVSSHFSRPLLRSHWSALLPLSPWLPGVHCPQRRVTTAWTGSSVPWRKPGIQTKDTSSIPSQVFHRFVLFFCILLIQRCPGLSPTAGRIVAN